MTAAQTVAGVCGELNGAVFELRQCIPLSWRGAAADEFSEQVEEVAARLISAADALSVAARLVAAHESRMAAIRAAMGQGV